MTQDEAELQLLDDCQVWMVGSVMEEDCDGLCWHYILRENVLHPELVVSTEPTGLKIHRGQRGRMEIRVRVKGRSCHGSMPHLGDNAVYKIAPAITAIEALNERLKDDEFLGKGTCAISWIGCRTPSARRCRPQRRGGGCTSGRTSCSPSARRRPSGGSSGTRRSRPSTARCTSCANPPCAGC